MSRMSAVGPGATAVCCTAHQLLKEKLQPRPAELKPRSSELTVLSTMKTLRRLFIDVVTRNGAVVPPGQRSVTTNEARVALTPDQWLAMLNGSLGE